MYAQHVFDNLSGVVNIQNSQATLSLPIDYTTLYEGDDTDNNVYNEGSIVNFNINTTNVANGTTLYWNITGDVDQYDLQPSALSGTITINNNQAVVTKTIVSDVTTEAQFENLVFNLLLGPANSGYNPVSSVSINIHDSSKSDSSPWLIGADYDGGFDNAVSLFAGQSIGIGSGEVICYTNYPTSEPMIVSGNLPSGTYVALETPPSGPPYSVSMYDYKIYGTPTAVGTFTVTFQVNNLLYTIGGTQPASKQFTRTFIVVSGD